jgi:hypothetical protein
MPLKSKISPDDYNTAISAKARPNSAGAAGRERLVGRIFSGYPASH